MATWTELQEYVRPRYATVERGEWIRLTWQGQAIGLTPATSLGEPCVQVMARVDDKQRFDLRRALELNAVNDVPALALVKDHCVLRVVLSLEGLTWQRLDRAIAHVAGEAARYRSRRRAETWQSTLVCFGMYGE